MSDERSDDAAALRAVQQADTALDRDRPLDRDCPSEPVAEPDRGQEPALQPLDDLRRPRLPAGFSTRDTLAGHDADAEDLRRQLDVLRRQLDQQPPPLPVRVRSARAARWVNGWTTRLLSPAARARFEHELQDELFDLVQQHASRYAQVGCAFRQLIRVLSLRREAGQQLADSAGD